MSRYTFGPHVQFEENDLDQIYRNSFGYRTDGTFVEVGAYDGLTYSHTCGLANIGWKGVYLEPVPELFEKCRHEYKDQSNVIVLPCAAGGRAHIGSLHIDEFSCCGSSLNPLVCKNPKTIKVPVLPLNHILSGCGVAPHFELLSIDVEFAEMEVLSGFETGYWLPQMIIIELCEKHPEPKHTWAKPARDYCEKMFPEHGYRKVYSDCINSIYIRP